MVKFWGQSDKYPRGQMIILDKFFLFLKIFLLPITLFAVQRDQVIVNEETISPNIEDFDCHSSSFVEVSPGVLCIAWKGGQGLAPPFHS